jgi:hypothetical protein
MKRHAGLRGQARERWLAFRRKQPLWVKRIGRAMKAAAARHVPSPTIDGALLEGCVVVANRHELIARLPTGGVVGEIGVDHGRFSMHILETARPAELHLFDVDFSHVVAEILSRPQIRKHEGPSARSLEGFADEFFDWLYIDGDHSYAGVKADCDIASRKVKRGGYLVFNDFALLDPYLGAYGVHRAVCEFIAEQRWPVSFFAFDRNGLYDIAVRRP